MTRTIVPEPVLFFLHSVYIPYKYRNGSTRNYVAETDFGIEAESKRLCKKYELTFDGSVFFSHSAVRLHGKNLANLQAASAELSDFLKAQAGLMFTEVEEELV
ncbi:hypothetical protein IYR97_26105 (plasmid) [Pseudomonas fulva]|jgi:hypothetical protein|uniref:Uncharacterized protein n=2 Tax=Pseudomonas putida group TaxID=136845 RepID=A0A1X0ZMX4_PSEPU|nr:MULTISPECIES: hypothetical protein [Pseudomonas]MCT8162859.1 hypothetical protein [Pseudomonas sp. HD6422]MCT8181372.1 hypothetical protein [Pseudomonas sp. HD6421]MDH1929036.1 hypothetical protein [Pseudomonas sp. GD03696]ORL58666.1 hypothetical protein B7H17_24340 [Pseudomonas putida]PLP92236.1 hypothetical protein CX682_09830 [Pseudomonas sp. FFUP_PS_41]